MRPPTERRPREPPTHEPSLPELLRLCERAARGKRQSPEVSRYLLDPVPRLVQLQRALAERTYLPGAPHGFVIHEPKRRVISALPFRDRIAQHFLVERTLPALEAWFAPQSYACRRGRGTHRAIRRATELCRNHEWLLRLDVAKFFPSADHAILLELLLPKCPPHLRWLIHTILAAPGHIERVSFHFPGDGLFTPIERPHGLPVGNLTSQIWANALLTPVDHMLRSELGLGHFVRYCDDIVVFAHGRAELEEAWQAVRERCDTLRLRLHPSKCRLHRTDERVTFLGFVLERRGNAVKVRLRSENVRRFRSRTRALIQLLDCGAIEPEEVLSSLRFHSGGLTDEPSVQATCSG